ncbi:MAG: glutaredoxin domain-containing protein [Dermatophilaceae bacterium]
MKAWLPTILYGVLGLVQLALAVPAGGGRLGVGVLLAMVLLFGAAYFAPTSLPTPASQEEAVAAARKGRVVVYHRSGCIFCQRLAHVLGRLRADAVWVDIWADAEAAAYVRSVNNGNETVPTVVIDGVARTNPSPRLVRRALAAAARS